MPSNLKALVSKGFASVPNGVEDLLQYEVYMGSAAYGCSSDTSDVDVYGFYIPPKKEVFPHLNGHIWGFDDPPQGQKEFQQHHINDRSSGKTYDYSIQSITRYFNLVMTNNPNMVDSLFVPLRCILYTTPVGQLVRDNRHLFLHKGCFHRFRGYAYQQLHKLRTKSPEAGKRKELIEKFGYDTKFAYNIVRLLLEVRQILEFGDLDLEKDREVYKSIRRGDWKLQDIEKFFTEEEASLKSLYENSKIPYGPDKYKIKGLLLNCLEHHFGNLSEAISIKKDSDRILEEIRKILL